MTNDSHGPTRVPGPTVVAVDVLERVFPDMPPTPLTGGHIEHVPRDGAAAFQFGVQSPEQALCRISVTPPIAGAGAKTELLMRLYHVLAVPVEGNSQGCSKTRPYPAQAPESWWPHFVRQAPFEVAEVLVEADTIPLTAGRTESVVADVRIPCDAAPGEYAGAVRFEITGSPAIQVPLRILVHPTTVDGYALHALHGLSPTPEDLTSERPPPAWWSEQHWALLEQAGRTMQADGNDVINTPLVGAILSTEQAEHPLIEIHVSPTGAYTFDYARFERWCELFFSLGFRKVAGRHLGGGHRLTPLIVSGIDAKTGQRIELFNRRSDTNAWFRFLDVFLPDLCKTLARRGWTDRYVQHLMDEPNEPEEYRLLNDLFRKRMPGIPNIDAIQSPVYSEFVDLLVCNLGTVQDADMVTKRKQRGQKLWHYQCCSPYPPQPNRWLDRTLANSRLYPLLGHLLQTDGYLFWAANRYRGADPYTSSIGPVPGGGQDPGHCVGDNWLYYRGPNGLRSSLRMLAFRDGMLDHKLLVMLAQRDKAEADALAATVMRSVDDYEQEPAAYHALRRQLLDALDSPNVRRQGS